MVIQLICLRRCYLPQPWHWKKNLPKVFLILGFYSKVFEPEIYISYMDLKTLNRRFILKLSQAESQRRHWHPTPVFSPGKSHGRRSLAGCSPWGLEESDTTERLHFHFSVSCTGEGNGNPPQCSCLENPRDGGAWWAAVYGVAQSQARLK